VISNVKPLIRARLLSSEKVSANSGSSATFTNSVSGLPASIFVRFRPLA